MSLSFQDANSQRGPKPAQDVGLVHSRFPKDAFLLCSVPWVNTAMRKSGKPRQRLRWARLEGAPERTSRAAFAGLTRECRDRVNWRASCACEVKQKGVEKTRHAHPRKLSEFALSYNLPNGETQRELTLIHRYICTVSFLVSYSLCKRPNHTMQFPQIRSDE